MRTDTFIVLFIASLSIIGVFLASGLGQKLIQAVKRLMGRE